MNVEELVRSSLEQRVRDLQPPVPDPAAVRARVHRRSRLRATATVGLAAAVVGGIVLGVGDLGDPDADTPSPPPPATSESAEVGVDLDVAPLWMVDGVLHLDGRELPQDREIATALVPVRSGAVYGAPDGKMVYQPDDGVAEVLEMPPGRRVTWGPASDPGSDVLAMFVWSEIDGQYDMSFFDVQRGEEIWSGPLSGMQFEGDDNPFGDERLAPISWAGTDPRGNYGALFTGPSFDSEAVTAESVHHYYMRGTRGAGTLMPLGPPAHDVTITVIAEAEGERALTFRTPGGRELSRVDDVRPDGGLSHDGAYYAGSAADADAPGAIAVVDTRTGETRHLEVADGTVPRHVSWAGTTTLMFLAADDGGTAGPGAVVACNTDTLQCAEVDAVGDISQVVLPRL